MSNGGFVYKSEGSVPQIRGIHITPVEVPDLQSGKKFEGLQGFAEAGMEFAQQMDTAQQQTRSAEAMTGFITDLDQAKTEALENPDYAAAPGQFDAISKKLEDEAVAKAAFTDPAKAAAFRLSIRQDAIGARGNVQAGALQKHTSAAAGARNDLELQLSNAAVNTRSPTERATYMDQFRQHTQADVASGLLTAAEATAQIQRFNQAVELGVVSRGIREEPEKTLDLMKDPANFPDLEPTVRQRVINEATAAKDQTVAERMKFDASGSTPEKTSLRANRILSPSHREAIFRSGILGQEGGLAGVVSGRHGTVYIQPSPGHSPNLKLVDPRLIEIVSAGAGQLPKGFKVTINSGFTRSGDDNRGEGSQHHRAGRGALDVQIWAPNGQPISNRGKDASGMYKRLAQAAYGEMLARYPELKGKFAWGGAFGTVNGGSVPDLMHFDLGGERGKLGPTISQLGAYPGLTYGGSELGGGEIPQGIKGLVSPKGALGYSQLMPDTAREIAGEMGIKLPDDAAGLKQLLLTDHNLNYRMGLHYWNKMLDRYDGNVALAAAAYNGGPGNADKWKAAAIEKFGVDATPVQIASVIGNRETKAYVLGVFHAGAVPATGDGISTGNRYTVYNSVNAILDSTAKARQDAIKDVATWERTGNADRMTEILKNGYSADMAEVERYLHAQEQGAAAGSVEAANEFRRVTDMRQAVPFIQQARQMPVSTLDSAITTLEANARKVTPSHEEVTRLEAYKQVRASIETGKNTDPVALGATNGLFKEVLLDPEAAPGDAGFALALNQRSFQAAAAQAAYGGALKPLHPADATRIGERVKTGAIQEQIALLRTMAASMTEAGYHAAITQMGLEPMLEVAGRTALGDPALAEKILIGKKRLDTEGLEKPKKELTDALKGLDVGNLYPANSDALDQAIKAGLAIYAANAGSASELFNAPDKSKIAKAMTEYTGELAKHGGVVVAAPPGVGGSSFVATVNGLTDDDYNQFGGVRDANGHLVDAATLRSTAVLKQQTPRSTKYWIGTRDRTASDGFTPYQRADGGAAEIDFAKVTIKKVAPAPATEADPYTLPAAPPAAKLTTPVEPPPPEPTPALKADPRRPLPAPDTSETSIYKNPPIGQGTGGLQ